MWNEIQRLISEIKRLDKEIQKLKLFDIPKPGASGGAGGHTIQEEGASLPARTKLNFTGAGVTAADNAGTGATDVTIPGGGGESWTKVVLKHLNAKDVYYASSDAGLSSALAAAVDGDIIMLPPFQFGDIVINKSISLIGFSYGANGGTTAPSTTRAHSIEVTDSNSGDSYDIIAVIDNISVDYTITGTGSASFEALAVHCTHADSSISLHINNCYFQARATNAAYTGFAAAVDVYGVGYWNYVYIRHSRFYAYTEKADVDQYAIRNYYGSVYVYDSEIAEIADIKIDSVIGTTDVTLWNCVAPAAMISGNVNIFVGDTYNTLSTWDVSKDGGARAGDLHASDIYENAYQRHLPLPGSAGNVPVSDGTNWVTTSNADFLPKFYPLTAPLTSTSWDGDSFSTTAKTLLDLSAVFGAPAGIKAIAVRVAIQDSGASGTDCWLILGPTNASTVGSAFACFPADDRYNRIGCMIVTCDANGDIYYQISASGASTCDIHLQIWGYWL